MELADESADGWPFRQYVASNCSSPSIGGISAVTNSSGNPFSLFYSPTNNNVHNNVIQSSRASNSWIASLRSNNKRGQSSSLIRLSTSLDSRQHHYELSNRYDASRINNNGTGVIHGRSFSVGRLPPTSHSLPSSSSRHWGSLESIHRNQRLKQLAAQSTTKVRSLSARESTAAAERWRYIQTVLQRRRKESLEHRERFIRQPLDNILRQKAINRSVEQGSPSWHSIAFERSILKRQTANWRMKANRHVHFDTIQQDEMEDCDDNKCQDRGKLPIIPIPEETEAQRNENPMAEQVDRRLPPLMIPSSGSGITVEGAGDDTWQLLSPTGPSWVERQVAKVRQRKMWASRQQQQQQHNLNQSPRVVLKRSISMVVNVSDADDRHSSDEEEDDRSLIQLEQMTRNQCLAWQVMLDKDELLDTPNGQKEDEPTVDYGGWPHFPSRLAVLIEKRQQRLKERKTSRKEKNMNRNDGIANPNNSFILRKRFGERLSMALIRQRKRKFTERISSSSGQKSVDRLANCSNAKTTNAKEKIGPASIVKNPMADASDVDHHLMDAISLQIPESPGEISPNLLSIRPDVVATIVIPSKEFDDISTRNSSSSDAISEVDVPQTAMDASSVSLETDEETIVADVYYHLESLISVADVIVKKVDDRLDETAGSAFCLPSGSIRQKEITDESISDVTVDDGPHLIDQLRDTSTTIPATSEEYKAEMLSGPDAIPSDIFTTEQTEHGIASPFQSSCGTNKGSPVCRRRPAYCSAWPLVISNQNSDAIPPNPVTLSYWNNLKDPTLDKTVVHQPEAGISSDPTSFFLGPENDPANPAEFMVMKNALDKKSKDAHNESRICFPSRSSIPTQTEPQPSPETKDLPPPEVDELNDPVDANVGETINDCQCLHRAVLTCLLPEAADTLANLELIRRQLKRARIRRQGTEQQRQPLQVRRDVHPGVDPNTQRP